jgi:hypothetical protein
MSCVSNVASFSGLFAFVLCILCCTKANNPEKLAILDTQDLRRRQTIQRNWQHWIHKTQDEGKQSRETGNIGYTRHFYYTGPLVFLSTFNLHVNITIFLNSSQNCNSYDGFSRNSHLTFQKCSM